ncbi:hypothetical protein ACQPYK_48585 (plasmid) [Streptosporangium sp. CA-135522]|uniref:hypothetical protein n=1 Tax=Streptosporangium sp. CA-135522 TaxID=3240072 RepID=UPI003D89B6E3
MVYEHLDNAPCNVVFKAIANSGVLSSDNGVMGDNHDEAGEPVEVCTLRPDQAAEAVVEVLRRIGYFVEDKRKRR